jgi:hypothetical protein
VAERPKLYLVDEAKAREERISVAVRIYAPRIGAALRAEESRLFPLRRPFRLTFAEQAEVLRRLADEWAAIARGELPSDGEDV